MIQQSQGYIVDRTREHLTATDAAVVRFRRIVMDAAHHLADGVEPDAPKLHELYRVRPGSWFAAPEMALEEVLLDRFGDSFGRVG